MNVKGSFILTLIVVLLILGGVCFVGYKYVYPKVVPIPENLQENNKYFGYVNYSFGNADFKIPATWTVMDVSGVTSLNSMALKINPSSEEDFMYIWKYGYAFDSETLAKEVVSYGFELISEDKVLINGNEFYNYVVSVSEEDVTRVYNTYAYVKDEVGYVFTLKCNSELYSVFKDKFVNTVESITIQ